MYELAALGLPSIILSHSEKNAKSAERFASHGSCLNLGFHRNVTPKQIAAKIEHLIDIPSKRLELSVQGRNLINKDGAKRIVDDIIQQYNQKLLLKTKPSTILD